MTEIRVSLAPREDDKPVPWNIASGISMPRHEWQGMCASLQGYLNAGAELEYRLELVYSASALLAKGLAGTFLFSSNGWTPEVDREITLLISGTAEEFIEYRDRIMDALSRDSGENVTLRYRYYISDTEWYKLTEQTVSKPEVSFRPRMITLRTRANEDRYYLERQMDENHWIILKRTVDPSEIENILKGIPGINISI